MPGPVAGQSSFVDGLSSLLTSLAPLKVLPDADLEVIANLEAIIVSAVQAGQAQGLTGQLDALSSSAPGMGGSAIQIPSGGMMTPGGPSPAGPMPGAMGAGAPGPGRGYSPQPSPPNPDSLRRLLQSG